MMAQLAVDDVSLRFGGVQALLDVSFAAPPGEILAIIGPNRACKPSLLTAIPGAYRPRRGRAGTGSPKEAVPDNPDVKEFYLGLTEVGARRSYREVKHYRRRKRWLS